MAVLLLFFSFKLHEVYQLNYTIIIFHNTLNITQKHTTKENEPFWEKSLGGIVLSAGLCYQKLMNIVQRTGMFLTYSISEFRKNCPPHFTWQRLMDII